MRKGHKRFDTYRSLVDVWCSSVKVGTFCRFGEGQNSEEFRYAHFPFESPLCKYFFLFPMDQALFLDIRSNTKGEKRKTQAKKP